MYGKFVFKTLYSMTTAILKTCSCSSSITVNVASVFLIGLQLATLQKTTHKTNKQTKTTQHTLPSPIFKHSTNPPPILFHQNIFLMPATTLPKATNSVITWVSLPHIPRLLPHFVPRSVSVPRVSSVTPRRRIARHPPAAAAASPRPPTSPHPSRHVFPDERRG